MNLYKVLPFLLGAAKSFEFEHFRAMENRIFFSTFVCKLHFVEAQYEVMKLQ